ncbi:STAS domain-containing protein [Streptomyces sp. NPDC002845]
MDSRDHTFALHHHTTGGRTVLELHGELDAWADQELFPRLAPLLDRPRPDVVADLRPASFLDAGGLRLLLRINTYVGRRHGTLRIVCTGPRLLHVLRLTRLDRTFTILDEPPSLPTTPGKRGVAV